MKEPKQETWNQNKKPKPKEFVPWYLAAYHPVEKENSMNREFYIDNRKALYQCIEPDSIVIFFSGQEVGKTGDECYPFFADRNFAYLTGIEQKESVLLAVTKGQGEAGEEIYLLPANAREERWTGRRLREAEVQEKAGIERVYSTELFLKNLDKLAVSGKYRNIYLDFYQVPGPGLRSCGVRMADYVRRQYPYLQIRDSSSVLKNLRLIKKPCEIEAMEYAEKVNGEGILAMMRHSRPGMYEYQYKAEYDYALAQNGVLEEGFPAIISGGKNNFCIHYYDYRGQVNDGDMVLNDVGVRWDNELTDVSRGWPCNGKYSAQQKLLYQCAFRTSEYMFSVLKPGILLEDVDKMIRKYNAQQMKEAGVIKDVRDVGTYMWHGGAHHVGFDVHDVVDIEGKAAAPGMVFCVDIGIYHEEWGIGFRLEDNCLITENGCRNLSAAIPRTIEEIESIMQ